ncbi:hypothetical protein G9A89_009192 [Geosiphon pyriformis]|nr:hypothetical protein G9A89_009192 [Geosiphon pyriformis]
MNPSKIDIQLPFPPKIKAEDFTLYNSNGKVKNRGANKFLIFRKCFMNHVKENYPNLQQTKISQLASYNWQRQPDYIKSKYAEIARQIQISINKARRSQDLKYINYVPPSENKFIEYNRPEIGGTLLMMGVQSQSSESQTSLSETNNIGSSLEVEAEPEPEPEPEFEFEFELQISSKEFRRPQTPSIFG